MSGSDLEWGLWPSQMACHPRLAASLASPSACMALAMRSRTSSISTPPPLLVVVQEPLGVVLVR
eukprot:2281134-Alexandrium_andersonii.AAC.1